MELLPGGERDVFRQLGTKGLKLIGTGAPRIHPQPDGLVAHKLDRANGLIYGGTLRLIGAQFVFNQQHGGSSAGGYLPAIRFCLAGQKAAKRHHHSSLG